MPEHIVQEYRRARRVAHFGSYALYFITALEVIILFTFVFIGPIESHLDIKFLVGWLASIVGTCLIISTTILLSSFLSRFSRNEDPFGKKQFHRIVLAGISLAARAVIDGLTTAFEPKTLQLAETSVTFMPTATLDLKVVVMVVFLVCLAMVVRYGDALKEDSDAFV